MKIWLGIIGWTLGCYIAASVLSFFGILLFERYTARDGFDLDMAPLVALVHAPFLGTIGMVFDA
jgi:hypothetical protein